MDELDIDQFEYFAVIYLVEYHIIDIYLSITCPIYINLDLKNNILCALVIQYGTEILGSGNDLSPDWPQAIAWTNVDFLLRGPLGTSFCEM